MEKWYSVVRAFKDESENPTLTEKFCDKIFQQIGRMRIKDKNKFKQRVGPEFESWAHSFTEDFPLDLTKEILNDDEFWTLTLKLARGI